ncbi:MAG TPA: TRAP transporter small permease [Candidatus Atribacteria bacterium]|nr:TRAP transporter small permease [Candidatus Atribacteria bacterium]
MNNLISIINKISEWSGKVLSYLILPLIGVVVYTAFMRYTMHSTPCWGFEISLFIYGIYFILGGAYCLRTDSHVSVDFFPRRLTIWGQKIFGIISNLVILFVCLYMFLYGAKWAWKSTQILERSFHQTIFNPQIWWYKWMVPVSAGMIVLQSFANIFLIFRSLFKNTEGE